MTESNVASRYAQALYEITPVELRVKTNEVLKSLTEAFDHEEIKSFLLNPKTPLETKQTLIRSLKLGTPIEQFLLLVMERRRDFLLAAIYREFIALLHAEQNKVVAKVTSAIALNNKQLDELATTLTTTTGKTVMVTTTVDEEIWGGMIVEMDGKVIDASLAHSINQLKQRLLAN